MSQATQPHTFTQTQEEDIDTSFNYYKAVKEAKADARDNLQILSSIYDNANNICKSLDRLDNLMEKIIFCNNKEKGK
jgi:hypothetical protein